jgi:cysteinyl-tRNA synthetase
MSTKYLGAEFDIHGGGMDLIPTHHTNEIAQNIACNHAQPAKFWMHTNMLTVNGQKMSKSLGNSFLPHELFSGNHELLDKGYTPMAVRFFMLQAHYRSTLDFSNEALQAAEKGLNRLINASEKLSKIIGHTNSTININDFKEKLYASMNEDFNTPMVIAHMFEGVRIVNLLEEGKERLSFEDLKLFSESFKTFLFTILGLKSEQSGGAERLDDLMEIILKIRSEAKARKDFTSSDEIRDRLKSIGIEIKDSKEGSTFQVAGNI